MGAIDARDAEAIGAEAIGVIDVHSVKGVNAVYIDSYSCQIDDISGVIWTTPAIAYRAWTSNNRSVAKLLARREWKR